jgi:hypothetical protein
VETTASIKPSRKEFSDEVQISRLAEEEMMRRGIGEAAARLSEDLKAVIEGTCFEYTQQVNLIREL